MNTRFAVEDTDRAELARYRTLSMSAVAAMALGVMSLVVLLGVVMEGPIVLLLVPVLGTFVGYSALRKLKRRADEFTGIRLAWIGTILSLVSLISGSTIARYVYLNEVPEGYRRVSYADLQPIKSRADLPVSPLAVELDGQRVFVKGYVLSDDRSKDLRDFVLVPDMMECCFGGNPKLTDMVQVSLREPMRVRFSLKRRKLGGVLRVDPRRKPRNGLAGVHFYLDADYLQ